MVREGEDVVREGEDVVREGEMGSERERWGSGPLRADGVALLPRHRSSGSGSHCPTWRVWLHHRRLRRCSWSLS